MKNTAKTGIRVMPGDNLSTNNRTANSYSKIDVGNDEIYYAAHPPASGLITLSFMNGKLANETPRNPADLQMIVHPENKENSEETNRCTIS